MLIFIICFEDVQLLNPIRHSNTTNNYKNPIAKATAEAINQGASDSTPWWQKITSEEKKKLEEKYNDLLAKNNQKIDLLTLGFVGEEIYQQVNIVFDKNVPYKNMKKIFITTAAAGFPKYRLIIKNEV